MLIAPGMRPVEITSSGSRTSGRLYISISDQIECCRASLPTKMALFLPSLVSHLSVPSNSSFKAICSVTDCASYLSHPGRSASREYHRRRLVNFGVVATGRHARRAGARAVVKLRGDARMAVGAAARSRAPVSILLGADIFRGDGVCWRPRLKNAVRMEV